MNIAVTGSLGTGKSTVSKILAATLGAELIDTDQLCRLQMQPGAEGFEQFLRDFGQRFIQDDGTIDRIHLRQAVFDDIGLKTKLEGILHPKVRRQVISRCRVGSIRNETLIVEVPLLYEVGWQDDFDICVVVYVPETLCIQRVIERDGMGIEEIKQILKAQIPTRKKLDYAHFIVENSGTFVSTVHQLNWLSREIKRR